MDCYGPTIFWEKARNNWEREMEPMAEFYGESSRATLALLNYCTPFPDPFSKQRFPHLQHYMDYKPFVSNPTNSRRSNPPGYSGSLIVTTIHADKVSWNNGRHNQHDSPRTRNNIEMSGGNVKQRAIYPTWDEDKLIKKRTPPPRPRPPL